MNLRTSLTNSKALLLTDRNILCSICISTATPLYHYTNVSNKLANTLLPQHFLIPHLWPFNQFLTTIPSDVDHLGPSLHRNLSTVGLHSRATVGQARTTDLSMDGSWGCHHLIGEIWIDLIGWVLLLFLILHLVVLKLIVGAKMLDGGGLCWCCFVKVVCAYWLVIL